MRIREFYDRITEGLALSELWLQFKSEARASYSLYSGDIDWDSFESLPRWKRFLKIAGAFFWQMLMHLSPARRIVLLLSLLLVFLGTTTRVEIGDAERITAQNHLGLYGALGLLLLLALELADRVILKRDLQIAREIQGWLVPSEAPEVPGLDIAFATRPANTVGGDFYDVVHSRALATEGESDAWLLVVADVAGKSVPAALLMATFQASLHSLRSAVSSLEELVRRMNEAACTRSVGGRRFTTAFFAEYSPESRMLRYINAGHNYPLLRRRGRSIEELILGGLPLGIDANALYETGRTELNAGDILVIYTDGVIEAVSEGEEEFGEDRFRTLIRDSAAVSAEALLASARAEINQFAGRARQHDDMTWMIARVSGE